MTLTADLIRKLNTLDLTLLTDDELTIALRAAAERALPDAVEVFAAERARRIIDALSRAALTPAP